MALIGSSGVGTSRLGEAESGGETFNFAPGMEPVINCTGPFGFGGACGTSRGAVTADRSSFFSSGGNDTVGGDGWAGVPTAGGAGNSPLTLGGIGMRDVSGWTLGGDV